MSSEYRLCVKSDRPIELVLAYKNGAGDPIDLDGKAVFFYYSDSGRPSAGRTEGNLIRFNVPTGKTRSPLSDFYKVEVRDLESGVSETIMSGPLAADQD